MSNIAILNSPGFLSLTGNQMIVKVAGKNAYVSKGQKASYTLSFYDKTTLTLYYPGDSITFAWGNNSLILVSEDSTSPLIDGPFTFPSPNRIDPWEYNAFVFNSLIKNAILVRDFNLYLDPNNNIHIDARQPGSDYDITFTLFEGLLSTNQLPAEDAIEDFYKIGFYILKNGLVISQSDLPVKHAVYNDDLPSGFDLDKTGIINVDIADILKKRINGNFTFPVPSGYTTLHSIVESYQIYVFEKFGNPPIERGGAFSSVFNILQGKFSNFSQGRLNDLQKTFLDKLQETGMFLTFAPPIKTTDIYAPEKLYFAFLTTGTYKVHIKQYYTDNTVDERDLVTFTAAQYDVREFFVSFDKIRTNAPKKLVKWEVYIVNNSGDAVSEIRTFIIDYTYQKHARYFLFKNSLGVYDLIRTTGKAIKKPKNNKEIVNIPLPVNFSEFDKEEIQVSNTTIVAYTINTGYVSKEYSDYLQQFLDSDDAYWLKVGRAYPITTQNNERTAIDDDDYNPNADIEITHSIHDDFTEKFSANEPILIGDFSPDFNTDYFTGEEPAPPEVVLTPFFFDDFSNTAQLANYNVPNPTLPNLYGVSISTDSDKMKISVPDYPDPTTNHIPPCSCDSNISRNIYTAASNWQIIRAGNKYRLSFDLISKKSGSNLVVIIGLNVDTPYNPDYCIQASTPGHYSLDFTSNILATEIDMVLDFDSFPYVLRSTDWIIIDNLKLENIT